MTILVIEQERQGAHQILLVTGELDLATVGDLITAGTTALADPDVHAVIVDLAGLTFIDSTGLGALVQQNNTAQSHASSFAVRGATGQTLSIMRLTALDTLLIPKIGSEPDNPAAGAITA